MSKGTVFLIPTYLSSSNDATFIAPMVKDVIKNTTYFLVENIRTARRYISSLNLGLDISALHFEIVDKNTTAQQVSALMKPVFDGLDVGVISEAGLPGLADPGSLLVGFAHQKDVRVVPLPGATSIQTAVISSGFSGQQYVFHGYLPIQKKDRTRSIRELEKNLTASGYTQVFMETPFRNMSLLEDLLTTLHPNTYLHIASDLFGSQEVIKSLPVKVWKSKKINLHKVPTVFCLGHLS